VQTEYSLWTRFAEADTLPLCAELGIGFVAYSPLGRGFLSGTIKAEGDLSPEDGRRRHPRFQHDAITHNAELLAVMRDIAVEHGASPGQVALAWVLAQGSQIVPIPSTTSLSHLEENVASAALALDPQEIEMLSSVFVPGAVIGERYPPAMLETVQR
jgi:aryl-alcohol dehydrogenase-like predicted oxidoreductase